MAERKGTYIAFAADGNEDFTKSDIRFYNLLKAWKAMKGREFTFVNPHEKGSTIRPWSMDDTIKKTLRARMQNSKRMMLLVGNTTKLDDDFVPYEIEYAISTCDLPVIVCYVNESMRITGSIPDRLVKLWPKALKDRIDNDTARTIHIPFRELIISKAISSYDYKDKPPYKDSIFKDSVYDNLYPEGGI